MAKTGVPVGSYFMKSIWESAALRSVSGSATLAILRVAALGAAGAAIGHIATSAHGWRQCILLLIAIALGSRSLLILWDLTVPSFRCPRHLHGELARTFGMLCISVLLVVRTHGVLDRLIWTAAVVVSALLLFRLCLVGMLSIVAIAILRRGYRRNPDVRARIYYVAITGIGSLLGSLSSFAASLGWTLWRMRVARRPGASRAMLARLEREADWLREQGHGDGWLALQLARRAFPVAMRVLWSGRILCPCLNVEDLRRDEPGFVGYILQNATTVVAAPSRLTELLPSPAASAFRALEALFKAGSLLERLSTRVGRAASAWDTDRADLLHATPVPTVLVHVELVDLFSGLDVSDQTDVGYLIASVAPRRQSQLVPQIADVVASRGVALVAIDEDLGTDFRPLLGSLATASLAPLADAYLRLRNSDSFVERFLCVIDCFDILVRFSWLVLAMESAGGGRLPEEAMFRRLSSRPTLGRWLLLLRQDLQRKPVSALGVCLARFWHGAASRESRRLRTRAEVVGAVGAGEVRGSNLEFLQWILDLRNATRGHGGVVEHRCRSMFGAAHGALMDSVLGLRELCIDAYLEVPVGGRQLSMRGWLRGGRRATREGHTEEVTDCDFRTAVLRYGEDGYDLGPFAGFVGSRCLTWNDGTAGERRYIDHSTGSLVEEHELSLGERTPIHRAVGATIGALAQKGATIGTAGELLRLIVMIDAVSEASIGTLRESAAEQRMLLEERPDDPVEVLALVRALAAARRAEDPGDIERRLQYLEEELPWAIWICERHRRIEPAERLLANALRAWEVLIVEAQRRGDLEVGYRRSVRIADGILRINSPGPEVAVRVSAILAWLTRELFHIEDSAKAQDVVGRAMAFADKLPSQGSSNVKVRAQVLRLFGRALEARGDFGEAYGACGQAATGLRRALSETPTDRVLLEELADALRLRGAIGAKLENVAEGIAAMREACGIYESLIGPANSLDPLAPWFAVTLVDMILALDDCGVDSRLARERLRSLWGGGLTAGLNGGAVRAFLVAEQGGLQEAREALDSILRVEPRHRLAGEVRTRIIEATRTKL